MYRVGRVIRCKTRTNLEDAVLFVAFQHDAAVPICVLYHAPRMLAIFVS